jgi:hypothetical protein
VGFAGYGGGVGDSDFSGFSFFLSSFESPGKEEREKKVKIIYNILTSKKPGLFFVGERPLVLEYQQEESKEYLYLDNSQPESSVLLRRRWGRDRGRIRLRGRRHGR